jgi:two-component system response regulator DctR
MSDGRTVAIIDDDEVLGRSMAKVLVSRNLAAEVFTSGETFLEQTGRLEEFGCILLDLRMPNVGGLEVFSAIQDLPALPSVLFLTGFGDVPASVEAMKMGAVDFLQKPVASEDLVEAVERSIRATLAARSLPRAFRGQEASAPSRSKG